MSTGLIIVAFFVGIIAVLFLIMLHELGHFIVAKLSKAYVYELSLGFGPRLFTKKGKETWYSIRLIPIGGFVSIASDAAEPPLGREEEALQIPDARKIDYIARWKKAFFIIAGPLMNFIIALFLITTIFMANGYKDNDMSFYGQKFADNSIAYKVINNQLEEQNLKSFAPDAQQYAITGWEFKFEDSQDPIAYYKEYDINDLAPTYTKIVYPMIDTLKAEAFSDPKNFETLQLRFSFVEIDRYSGRVTKVYDFKDSNFYKIDKEQDQAIIESWKQQNKISMGIAAPTRYFKSTASAYGYGWKETFDQSIALLKGLGMLFTGNIQALSGPLGMASQTATVMNSPTTFFLYVAGISANLFMLNMIPIPPLDGYRFLENAVEAVTKKPLNKKFKLIVYSIGALLFAGLFIIITLKDLLIG
ncbi:M50 family metallopeptidase [Mesoplasma seiffertii]|uniref:M50 family metallopeptidase n=1 Tax=Mesoplasma seiffertii TaxID=28224 RepID=UPI00047DB2E9|nr:site-2 protease family protein [Mesoplasma seiffertii]